MQNRWVLIGGGVLFVLVGWNTWTVQQLSQRVSLGSRWLDGTVNTNNLVSTTRAVMADGTPQQTMALRNNASSKDAARHAL